MALDVLKNGLVKVSDKFATSPMGSAVAGAVLGAGAGTILGVTAGKISARKRPKRKTARKRTTKRGYTKKRVTRKKTTRRKTTRKKSTSTRTSSKKIKYTKRGQPYIILSNGRARFISHKSAGLRKKRKGGYY